MITNKLMRVKIHDNIVWINVFWHIQQTFSYQATW